MSLAFSGSQEWLVSLGSESLQCIVLYRALNRFWDDAQVVCSAQVALGKFIWTQFIDGNEISIAVGGTCGALYFFVASDGNCNERLPPAPFVLAPL